MADWLGFVNTWNRKALLTLLEDLRPRLPELEERELYAILQQGGVLSQLHRAFRKGSPLKLIKDLQVNEGRGVEEALEDAPEEPAAEEEDQILLEEDPEDLWSEHPFEDDSQLDYSGGLPTLVSGDALRTIDKLSDLSCGLDDETAEFLVENRVAALWNAYINEGVDAVETALEGEGGHYFDLIRSRFYRE